MESHKRGQVNISYDREGDGPPVLLLAPGGMRSANNFWNNMPWNPREKLQNQFELIGMDQRNAGDSIAPITKDDNWDTYKQDQISLLDYLEVEKCHLIGMCIGGPFIANLLKTYPERFKSAVMLQPVGIEENRQAFYDMFDDWAKDIMNQESGPTSETMEKFKHNMWDGEFLITTTEQEVSSIQNPLLIFMGDDLYHPQSTSRKIAELAPNATLIEKWKNPELLESTNSLVIDFLKQHSE
tara:strand:- start:16774 stop:17493 length:720 start_codon:yes stop_codon:yes gene_type:complete